MVVQPRNVPERRREEFAALMRQELKVGRAWTQKRGATSTRQQAGGSGKVVLLGDAQPAESIRKAAETVCRHIANIVTYYQHPVTNAMSEGLNSKIQKIKSMACGFRNTENFKAAIYFHCGGLDLYPY